MAVEHLRTVGRTDDENTAKIVLQVTRIGTDHEHYTAEDIRANDSRKTV